MGDSKRQIFVTLLLMFAISISAQTTPFGKGLFRYSAFGHSLYADVHPNFVRLDVPYSTNNATYDWGQTGKNYRWNTFATFGFQLPIWTGNLVNEQFALSVTMPMSANIWLDLLEPVTAPVVNTDYRIGLPTWTFMQRLNKGFAKNYSLQWAPFKHESTHIGDELQIQHIEQGYALKRVNVSYNYTELIFTLNEAENRYEQNHTFRVGLMLLWSPKSGWYFVDSSDGDAALTQPKISPWEAYLQYQYQSPTSKHGFQGVASAEIRNRAQYGYSWNTAELQAEKRIFTYNIFVGCRYNVPNYDGYFSRVALGFRAYHGNCPYGQFRNIENYNQMGFCLIFE